MDPCLDSNNKKVTSLWLSKVCGVSLAHMEEGDVLPGVVCWLKLINTLFFTQNSVFLEFFQDLIEDTKYGNLRGSHLWFHDGIKSSRNIKHYLNPCVSYVCLCDCRILARRAKTRNVGVWKLSSSQLQTVNPCMWSAYFRSQLPFLDMDCQCRFIGHWHFYFTFNIIFLCAYSFSGFFVHSQNCA